MNKTHRHHLQLENLLAEQKRITDPGLTALFEDITRTLRPTDVTILPTECRARVTFAGLDYDVVVLPAGIISHDYYLGCAETLERMRKAAGKVA